MKTRILLSLLMIFVLLLAACQAAQPAPQETEAPVEETAPTEPAPAATEESAYPGPGNQSQSAAPETTGESLYPGPQDGDTVSWLQAKSLLKNGEVAEIIQTHDLQVRLTLKDGRTLVTTEPEIDEIFTWVELCGDLCADITLATE